METLEPDQLESIQAGVFCTNATSFLGGFGLGVSGLTYFGIVTLATGGGAVLVGAIAGAGLAIYCA